MMLNFKILFFLIGLSGSLFAQYQFPLDAVERLKTHLTEYSQLVSDERYLHISMETFSRKSGNTSGVRFSDFYKNDKMVIIRSHDISYYIDDSLMITVNSGAKKIYIKQTESKGEIATDFMGVLIGAFDSIVSYTSAVTYTERENTLYQYRIEPKYSYMFDNLNYQNMYYSKGAVLPDSTVLGYYDEVPFEEITTYQLVSKKKPLNYPYNEASVYFFDKKGNLLTPYKNYSVSKL